MIGGGGNEMRTAWPDRIGADGSPAAGVRPGTPPRIDRARLVAWIVVLALAVVFWGAVGLLIAAAV